MAKKSKKTPSDTNQLAAFIVGQATEEGDDVVDALNKEQISQLMKSMGRRGGLKGGKVRADRLSSKRKKEIAKKAADLFWLL